MEAAEETAQTCCCFHIRGELNEIAWTDIYSEIYAICETMNQFTVIENCDLSSIKIEESTDVI